MGSISGGTIFFRGDLGRGQERNGLWSTISISMAYS